MEIIYDALVVLHLLGMASIVSGVVARTAVSAGSAPAIMLVGSSTQVVTGMALVGIASAGLVGTGVDNTKIAVKLVVAVLVLLLALLLWRRPEVRRGAFPALAGLTLANVVIAVFW
jgi:hypothetical protein